MTDGAYVYSRSKPACACVDLFFLHCIFLHNLGNLWFMQPVIDVIITMYARIAHQLPFCNTCTRACVYSCAHLLYAMSLCYYPRALSLYFFTYIHNTYIYILYYISIYEGFPFFLSIQFKNSIKFNRDCKKIYVYFDRERTRTSA